MLQFLSERTGRRTCSGKNRIRALTSSLGPQDRSTSSISKLAPMDFGRHVDSKCECICTYTIFEATLSNLVLILIGDFVRHAPLDKALGVG